MADLTITIDAQTLAGVRQAFGEVQRAFAQLERATQQTGQRATLNLARIETKLADLSRTARNFGLVATGALGGMVAMLARAGNQALATEAALRNLTGSAEAGRKLFEQINREASQFVMQRQTMLATARQLLAAQISPDAILPTLRAIDAALAATGDTSEATAERIARAFAQIANKGRLSMEEINQLTDAGVPALRVLQKELGLTDQQLADLMQGKLAISGGQALAALINGLTREFGNLRQELMNTPVGQLSNLQDNLNRLLTTAGTPLSRSLTDLLKSINAQLTDMAQSGEAAAIGYALADALKTLAATGQALLPVVTSLLRTFNSLPEPVRNTIATIALLSGPLALATTAIANLARGVLTLIGALRALPAVAAAAGNAVRTALAQGAGAAPWWLRLGAVGAAFASTLASAGAQDLAYAEVLGYIPASQPNRQQLAVAAADELRMLLAERGLTLSELTATQQGRARLRQLSLRAVQQAQTRRATGQPAPAPAPLTPARIELPSIPAVRGGATRAVPDPLARQRAALELARQAAELGIPNITGLIAQSDLDAAAQQLSRLRSELERLIPAYAQLRQTEAQAQLGRPLSARERQTLAETARRDLLASVLSLEQQIAQARQRAADETERELKARRDQLAQLQRELHALQTQMLQERISALPPQEALAQLPTLQAMLSAPHAADLAIAMLGGDATRAQISALQLQRIQEQIARQRQQLEQQIADEQRRRAEEQYQLALQTAQAEREINRLKAESAIALAEAELQNARDTLQVLQQQGASREILKAQEQAILQAQEKLLLRQKDALELARQQLQLEIQRLAALQAVYALTGQTALRNQAALQAAQAQLELARAEGALSNLERQLRNIKIVADENNPFELWRRAVYDLTQQLADGIADALLGMRRMGDVLKDFFGDLARTLLRIVLRELLNPLLDIVRNWAAQLGRAIFGNFVGNQLAGAAAAGAAGQGGALAGLGNFFKTPFGQALGAAGIGYFAGQALGLNPTGSAVGAGIGMAIGGPIGAVVGGLLGGLLGGRRSRPQPQIVPLTTGSVGMPSLQINNTIRLYLDNREISRAVASNAL